MKGFTIKLPKQNIDPQGSLKNRILNEVKNRLPFAKWYGIHTPEDPEYSISYAGPVSYTHLTLPTTERV